MTTSGALGFLLFAAVANAQPPPSDAAALAALPFAALRAIGAAENADAAIRWLVQSPTSPTLVRNGLGSMVATTSSQLAFGITCRSSPARPSRG